MNKNGLERWAEESLARKRLEQNNNFDLLSKLTIVIASYGRQAFLLRQAVYWGYSQANIIIVDGSPSPLTDRMCNILAGLPNFHYLHSKDDVYSRLKLASEYIQTPYVVSLSDDEFLLKDSLCRAISILDANDELVACNGQVVGFGCPKFGGGISYFQENYAFFGYAILEDSAQDRLSHAMATYHAVTCFAVLRRDVWVQSWGRLQPRASLYAGEIYQAITTYLYGKLVTLDEIYMLRSNENAPVSIEHTFDRKLEFGSWWQAPCFAIEREDFLSQLTEIAVECLGLSTAESRKIVENAVADYVAFEEARKGIAPRSLHNTVRATISKILRRVMTPESLQSLKLFLKKLAGREYQVVVSENTEMKDESKKNWMMFSRSSNDANNLAEMQAIETLVSEFYEALAKDEEESCESPVRELDR